MGCSNELQMYYFLIYCTNSTLVCDFGFCVLNGSFKEEDHELLHKSFPKSLNKRIRPTN